MENNEFVTRNEAMRILGVCGMTIIRYQKEGRLTPFPGVKKRSVVFRRTEIEGLLPGNNKAA